MLRNESELKFMKLFRTVVITGRFISLMRDTASRLNIKLLSSTALKELSEVLDWAWLLSEL